MTVRQHGGSTMAMTMRAFHVNLITGCLIEHQHETILATQVNQAIVNDRRGDIRSIHFPHPLNRIAVRQVS